jgi:hypothetical protein
VKTARVMAENKRLKKALPLCTTAADNLLTDIRKALQTIKIFERGSVPFNNIWYCVFCHYSQSHGHGETCIILRLDSALDGEGKQ